MDSLLNTKRVQIDSFVEQDPQKIDFEDTHSASSGSERSAKEIQEREELVQEETKAVRRTKWCVFGAIIVAGILATYGTYRVVRAGQQETFRSELQSFGDEIEDVSDFTATQAFSIVRSLSKSVTAMTLDGTGNQSFPFATIPHWHVMAEEARLISGAEIVALTPLVHTTQRKQWEEYATSHQGWIHEGLDYCNKPDVDPGRIPEELYYFEGVHEHKEGEIHLVNYHLPVWQITQAPTNASVVNLDLTTRSSFEHTAIDVIADRHTSRHTAVDAMEDDEGVLSDICDFTYLTQYSFEIEDASAPHPQSYILEPVFEDFSDDAPIVAFIVAIFPWNNYFRNIFPETVEGVDVVIDDRCGDVHTYRIHGPSADYVGKGDLHEYTDDYVNESHQFEFAEFARFKNEHPTDGSITYEGTPEYVSDGTVSYEKHFGQSYTEKFKDSSKGHCSYVVSVYSSELLRSSYFTSEAAFYAIGIAILFVVILGLVLIFDRTVIVRQRKLMDHAAKTRAIVSSLFPENVQKRMMEDLNDNDDGKYGNSKNYASTFQASSRRDDMPFDTKPIADFFPDVTIMFADLVGFTAWSSMREPAQVFSLLETLFGKFDSIARSRGVFKVETVGDCYVAASGLPEPNMKHAEVIAEFSRHCLSNFLKVVSKMEVNLGIGTADLGLRIGVHSGSVTAGVLRGEKSRFQLFGDTVNTASRIETTGEKNRIHISQETAALLSKAGFEGQLTVRDGLVQAKGKGKIQTYWLSSKIGSTKVHSSGATVAMAWDGRKFDQRKQRNIRWNHQNLRLLLQPLAAKERREGEEVPSWELHTNPGETVLDEVKDIIPMPRSQTTEEPTQLSPAVDAQLYEFVRIISTMYRDNSFHNFDHASHVTMSVTKLLSRITAVTIDYEAMEYDENASPDFAYGISNDPLTQFACAFSALVHDVQHTGVPNAVLVKERDELGKKYNNKSVAEQNSIDLAWDVLMSPDFDYLRGAICKTQEDFLRFRALVVNMVMATDVMDKELGAVRKKRWQIAFGESEQPPESARSQESLMAATNRKATIVIEHLIQASDVAHTMQHWHVYTKWNGCLFREMRKAFKDGRLDSDPADGWYEGELKFFDFYVIPLATKLKTCKVFGVASDEYLMYAEKNREEWALKGKDIVGEYLKEEEEE